jgi:hypothetical protein
VNLASIIEFQGIADDEMELLEEAGQELNCDMESMFGGSGGSASTQNSTIVTVIPTPYSCLLDSNDVKESDWGIYFGILIAIFVSFRFLGLLALIRKSRDFA